MFVQNKIQYRTVNMRGPGLGESMVVRKQRGETELCVDRAVWCEYMIVYWRVYFK